MKKFIGNLDSIAPSKLIDKNKISDLDRLFLGLGLIYNDLKGLILFDITIRETYEQPVDLEPNVHGGEYQGVRLQIERMFIALVYEFFTFINRNIEIINSAHFQIILKNLDIKDKNSWNEFILIATQKSKSKSLFAKLARIRNSIVSHYDISEKALVGGFINKFYNQEKIETNKKAFFSLGKNMESTRFFYCDASIEAYLVEHLEIKPSESNNYLVELMQKVEEMNTVICKLIRKYIEKKKLF